MSEEYFKRVYHADPANAGKQSEALYSTTPWGAADWRRRRGAAWSRPR